MFSTSMPDSGYLYRAYGLNISSERPIFEFGPQPGKQAIDVDIRWAPITFSPDYSSQDWHFECDAGQATLCFRGVGVFHLPHSRSIIVAPEANADARMVERYLSGVVFAVLLYLRGLIVFHASCVVFNQQDAVAFIGDSGAGKSTLATMLHLQGYPCMNDDVTPVRVEGQRITAQPGIPFVKIDPDLARRKEIAEKKICKVHPEEPQVYLSLAAHLPQQPVPVRALIFLQPGSGASLQRITARQTMMEIIRYTLPARLLFQTGTGEHFLRSSRLASSVPAYTLTRDLHGDTREQVAQLVINEFAV